MGIYFRGIGYRCAWTKNTRLFAVDASRNWLRWNGQRVSEERLLMLLRQEGLQPMPIKRGDQNKMINLIPEIAQDMDYRVDAKISEAPGIMNCSTLIYIAHALVGIGGLPISAMQLHRCGKKIAPTEADEGDLVFSVGRLGRGVYRNDPVECVGHVGIVVGQKGIEQGVAHATEKGLELVDLESFRRDPGFRGARRLVKDFSRVYTVLMPEKLASGKCTENFVGSECILTHLARRLPFLMKKHPESSIVPHAPSP